MASVAHVTSAGGNSLLLALEVLYGALLGICPGSTSGKSHWIGPLITNHWERKKEADSMEVARIRGLVDHGVYVFHQVVIFWPRSRFCSTMEKKK